jgi:hypothetical protein
MTKYRQCDAQKPAVNGGVTLCDLCPPPISFQNRPITVLEPLRMFASRALSWHWHRYALALALDLGTTGTYTWYQ